VVKSRTTRWAGHAESIVDRKDIYRGSEGKRPLRKPRRKYEDNIKADV